MQYSASDQYCAYCSDSNGNLNPSEEAVSGFGQLPLTGKKVGPEEATKRAKRYLTAMKISLPAHKADEKTKACVI